LSRIFDQLKKRGFTYAVFPYLPEPERGGIEVIQAVAEKFNRAGEKCRAAGLWTFPSCCARRRRPGWRTISWSRIRRRAIRWKACGRATGTCPNLTTEAGP